MRKIDTLNGYIEECNEVIKSGNNNTAFTLVNKVDAVYRLEIKRLLERLPYSGGGAGTIMDDLPTLICILENHKDDLELEEIKELRELERLRLQSSISVTNNNNSNSTATSSSNTTVSISFHSTVERLQALPDTTISQEEKEALEEKLAALQIALDSRDNDKAKLKLTNVLKYIGDKCVDAGIAVLPYLGQIAATI